MTINWFGVRTIYGIIGGLFSAMGLVAVMAGNAAFAQTAPATPAGASDVAGAASIPAKKAESANVPQREQDSTGLTGAASGGSLRQAATDRPVVQQGIPSTDQLGVSHIGDVAPAPPATPRQGPLASIGRKLNDWGFSPSLNLVQMYLTNPSVGQQTGKHEALTFISVGGDFDMEKIAGFPGATIHFQQIFVPFTNNLAWGSQVGDVLAGQPGPYVPQISHLGIFTWEQKAFHDKLDVEFGKANAGAYFAAPVCNQGFGCQSAILQNSAGMNPPVYVNWGGRVRYNITPEWSMQAGLFRSNPAYPFTNGWEWTDSVPDSNVWLASTTYRTTYQTDPYPKSYELMLYYNTRTQTDPLTEETHKGTSGIYIGGRQVVWRADGGLKGAPDPTAVSLFATATGSFDWRSSYGIAMTGSAGVILDAPLRSRPHDSISLSLNWATLTPHEQAYLKQENLASGGTGYTVARTQYGLKLDANIAITRSIILSPYVMRTWNTSTWGNPTYTATPKNGFAAGIVAAVFFDKMLGLTDH
ncbi:carbohydrate porin [Burkholderia multivorans]|uniref:Porin n=1 Tax=Burkholderia multivorans TaxID=87883 RepID=A0AB37ARR3_9BURK|nr:carbohydrate porin [Burkholderia multivorans]PRE45680.1 porin [Burkholderia multivorans]PRE48733.1 porin [Burkholderia multivorans]